MVLFVFSVHCLVRYLEWLNDCGPLAGPVGDLPVRPRACLVPLGLFGLLATAVERTQTLAVVFDMLGVPHRRLRVGTQDNVHVSALQRLVQFVLQLSLFEGWLHELTFAKRFLFLLVFVRTHLLIHWLLNRLEDLGVVQRILVHLLKGRLAIKQFSRGVWLESCQFLCLRKLLLLLLPIRVRIMVCLLAQS